MILPRRLMCAVGRHSGRFAYVDAGRCEQVRRCGRCAMAQSRAQHVWGPWRYANTEFGAPQFHRCRRCHKTEKTARTRR
jgi:hypothetical protein